MKCSQYDIYEIQGLQLKQTVALWSLFSTHILCPFRLVLADILMSKRKTQRA